MALAVGSRTPIWAADTMGRIVATSKLSERPELTRTGWRLALPLGVEAVALCRRAQSTAISSIQQTM